MMSYEEFKSYLMDALPYELPEILQIRGLVMETIERVNGHTLDGIRFQSTGEEFESTPVIYAQDLYDDYQDGEPLEEILKTAAACLVYNVGRFTADGRELIKNGTIIFQLVNTAKNAEMLADTPHREFLDLSVIYRVFVGETEHQLMSMIIRNDTAEEILHMDEEALFQAAKENTPKRMPLMIKTMKEFLMESFFESGLADAEEARTLTAILPDNGMFLVTNTHVCDGAVCMLYPGALQSIADRVGCDLYILPSSVHEVLAVPVLEQDKTERDFAEIVKTVNRDPKTVREEQYLSDSVYRYDRKTGNLSIVA